MRPLGVIHTTFSLLSRRELLPHLPLIYHLGFTFTFGIWLALQSLPPCWPYIRFLFVVVKELLHHFLHPSLAAFDLWFTTLGGKYLWSDFHRLAVCHARHTIENAVSRIFGELHFWYDYCWGKCVILFISKKDLPEELADWICVTNMV